MTGPKLHIHTRSLKHSREGKGKYCSNLNFAHNTFVEEEFMVVPSYVIIKVHI